MANELSFDSNTDISLLAAGNIYMAGLEKHEFVVNSSNDVNIGTINQFSMGAFAFSTSLALLKLETNGAINMSTGLGLTMDSFMGLKISASLLPDFKFAPLISIGKGSGGKFSAIRKGFNKGGLDASKFKLGSIKLFLSMLLPEGFLGGVQLNGLKAKLSDSDDIEIKGKINDAITAARDAGHPLLADRLTSLKNGQSITPLSPNANINSPLSPGVTSPGVSGVPEKPTAIIDITKIKTDP